MRRIIAFSVIGLALFGVGLWRLSDGFSIAKMRAPLPFDLRWEVENPATFKVRSILSQPFYYIGKGSQVYVFESADNQYVLKFFRLSRYRLPPFQEALPLPPFLAEIQNKKSETKRVKQEKLFASCTLAYNELKEECGLVYLHLNKTACLAQDVTLYNNLKRPISIPIDQYAFLIQRKGEQPYAYLGRLIDEGKVNEAKNALLSLATLLDRRIEKGIVDDDAEIHKNAGFINGKAVFFDTGQFRKEEKAGDSSKGTRKLLQWLESKDQRLASDAQIILLS